MDGCGDGSWKGERYFTCPDGHALFIVLSKLKPDPRFVQQPQGSNRKLCVSVFSEYEQTLVHASIIMRFSLNTYVQGRCHTVCVGTI